MKLNGILGKGSGKLGSSVFAINSGEQIVREYTPRVSNPRTNAQVAQRARFKLLSQLAVIFASYNAFKKDGLVSKRNQFVSANMNAVTYADNEAKVNLLDIVLSNGSRNTITVGSNAVDASHFNIIGYSQPESRPDAMLLVVARPDEDGYVTIIKGQIVTTANENGEFIIPNVVAPAPFVVYGVGLYIDGSSNKDSFNEIFGEINDETNEMFVTVDVIKKVLESASVTTKTATFLQTI